MSDAIDAHNGLFLHRQVPVPVEQEDVVCRGKREPYAACTNSGEEDAEVVVRGEGMDRLSLVAERAPAVKTCVPEPVLLQTGGELPGLA